MVTRTAGSEVALRVNGPDLGPPEQNLAVRAARAVLEATEHKFGVAIELTKRIPVQAGLGGGSSHAARRRCGLLRERCARGAGVGTRRAAVPTPCPAGRARARGPDAAAARRRHPRRVPLVGRHASRARGARDDAAMVLGEKHQRLIKTATRSVAAPGPEAT